MADRFETIRIEDVEEQLQVFVMRDGWSLQTAYRSTHISALPPFEEDELTDIQGRLVSGHLTDDRLAMLTDLTIDSSLNNGSSLQLAGPLDHEKVGFSIALTQEVMLLRGLHFAVVDTDGAGKHIIRELGHGETDKTI